MALRRILCTQCDRPLEVDEGAKSVNCLHCNTRVVTEAMTVDAYVAVRRFTTANRMKITKKGLVYASVRADALEIEGFLQGDALSLSGIRLSKTARVTANLRAARLALEPGATLSGDMRIGPDQVPEIQGLVSPMPPRE
jgi:LSD1 subclass zinc finger protein